MLESGITTKGQTTLPKPVRKALGLSAGDRVRYTILDGKVMLYPALPAARLYGMLKYEGPPASLEDMDRTIAEGAVESGIGSSS